MGVSEDLEELARLYRAKHVEYGETDLTFGRIMVELFPDGLMLDNVTAFNRAALLFHVVDKLLRYCNNHADGGHQDSLRDLSVYAAMLRDANQPREQ